MSLNNIATSSEVPSIQLSTFQNTSLSEMTNLLKIKPSTQDQKNLDIEMNSTSTTTTTNTTTLTSKYRKYGNWIPLLYKEGNPQYIIGPFFPWCLLLNCAFPIYTLYFLYNTIHYIFFYMGIPIAIFQILSFLFVSTANPGWPKIEYEEWIYEDKSKNYRKCKDCKMWINTEEGANHCKICKICIEGYDHHCSLMNICIGKNNVKAFYVYVLGTFAMVGYFVVGFLGHSNHK